MYRSIGILSIFSTLLLMSMSPARADICHVTVSAGGDGTNWSSPTDLQGALSNTACDEIWVAAGTYEPTSGTDRSASFNIPPGVTVYGGFLGDEIERDARDPAIYATVLSGDLSENDTAGFSNRGENSYNVVRMDGTGSIAITSSTVLDGFTIHGGNANTGGFPHYVGGGLYCNGSGAGHECSPTLSKLRFTANTASYGAALFNDGRDGGISSPTLHNVTFHNNSASSYGGAMVNNGDSGESSPMLINVTFHGNYASSSGGAMTNDSSANGSSNPTLINVTFSGNSTAGNGGAMFNGASGSTTSPTLINVTFSNNTADTGGAMFNVAGSGGIVRPTLRNVILWGNSASIDAEIHNTNAVPLIDHSIVQGSGGSDAWDAALGTDGGGNLDLDPVLGPLQDNGGLTLTMLPGEGSVALDAGDDTTCASTDQRGVVRLFFAPCDIGAVEAGGLPILMVTDGNAYARYGQTVDYVVTLRNRTGSTFSGVSVNSNLPTQFDATEMHWVCLGGGGATCTASGNGALDDSAVMLPPYGALSWLLSAPVRDDADDTGGIVLTVSASGAPGVNADASDTDTVTLFRDGFDVAGANGAQRMGGHGAASISTYADASSTSR